MNAIPDFNALFDDAQDLENAWFQALEPSDPPSALDWISENFKLSDKDSAMPGSISLDPWQSEIIRAFDDPTTREIVVMASSQVGKTVIGLGLLNYSVIHRPGPMLFLHENDIAAEAFSKDRISPSIECNPTNDFLQGRRSGAGQTITRLEFSTGTILNIAGANSPAKLSSRPVKTLIATEVRGFPVSAGRNGDPLSMASARQKSYRSQAKAFIESSPGLVNHCRLTEAATRGDMSRWHLECAHCNAVAPVSFHPVQAEHSVYFDAANPTDCGISCHECGTVWSDQERLNAIRNGFFRATKEPEDQAVRSFLYSEIESPRSTIASIVKRYLEARNHPERLQAFDNTVLGVAHDPDQQVSWTSDHELMARAEQFDGAVLLPREALVLTAGCDVQTGSNPRIEIQIFAYGKGEESWSIDYIVINGNLDSVVTWDRVEEALAKRYKHPLFQDLPISVSTIDSGDGNVTQKVYDFSVRMQTKNKPIFAIKGRPGDRPIVQKSAKTFLSKDNRFALRLVGVDSAKTTIFNRLNQTEKGAGTIHFPAKYSQSFFKGLTSEKQRIKTGKDGKIRREYFRSDFTVGGEPLDTAVYALAARHMIPDDFEVNERRLIRKATGPDLSQTAAQTKAKLQAALSQINQNATNYSRHAYR